MRYSLLSSVALAASFVAAVPTTPLFDIDSQGIIPSRIYNSVQKWWNNGASNSGVYQGIKIGSVEESGVVCEWFATVPLLA